MAFVIKLLNPNLQFSCDYMLTLRLPCFWSGNLCLDTLVLDHVSRSSHNFWPYSTVQWCSHTWISWEKKSGIPIRTRRNLRRNESTFILILFRMFLQTSSAKFSFSIFSSILSSFSLITLSLVSLIIKISAMGPTSSKIYSSKKCISEAA